MKPRCSQGQKGIGLDRVWARNGGARTMTGGGGARLVWAEPWKDPDVGMGHGSGRGQALQGPVVASAGSAWKRARVGGVPDWGGKWADRWLHGCGRGMNLTRLAAAFTHLLQLQPHFVEGSKPVGFGPGHGVLTLLAFLILSSPETETRGVMRLQGRPSLDPLPLE